MWKKTMILTIVCVLALAIVSIAEDRMPVKNELQKRFDRNSDGFIDREEQKALHKSLELRERIEKLREMAREAEKKALCLWFEAEELEQVLKREIERWEMAGRMEKMHAHKEAAERAAREGQHDRAAELREKARRIAAELKEKSRAFASDRPRLRAIRYDAMMEQYDEYFERLKQQLEHQREMAREAKQRGELDKAERLLAGVKEFEQMLKPALERREAERHIEEMHIRLAELKEAIEHAKREGRHDKAAELHERAMRMADEIKAHQREAGEKKFHEAEKRVVQLQEMAREAKERGQMDKAERLWAEAKELKGLMKREIEHRDKAKHIEEMHAELAELKEAIEHAKREGQHDKADALRKKAEHLAGKIAKPALRDRDHDIKKEIEHLHAMAGKAKEAGDHEKAEAILREAKNLQRGLHKMAERDKEKAHKKSLEHLVEELRDEVKGLRQEVEKLKRSRQGHD